MADVIPPSGSLSPGTIFFGNLSVNPNDKHGKDSGLDGKMDMCGYVEVEKVFGTNDQENKMPTKNANFHCEGLQRS